MVVVVVMGEFFMVFPDRVRATRLRVAHAQGQGHEDCRSGATSGTLMDAQARVMMAENVMAQMTWLK
ncbi:hypothetical protein DB30_06974 [Enhygromyxa salina]|uniref:Uncharacterized protein n=1 Tax=Enhygromyxa salina TaxID=215803 RepID=A0A0C2CX98_9BACT|nr:hypothetical protein [Enhygromyxa salina]KIG14225.1 hypothetical protein DB30_06974 [Enhygromyxa salina]